MDGIWTACGRQTSLVLTLDRAHVDEAVFLAVAADAVVGLQVAGAVVEILAVERFQDLARASTDGRGKSSWI